MGDSSDEEDNGNKAASYPQRPSRPLPLSLVAASLDLPTLTHARNNQLSPQGSASGRRIRWTVNEMKKTTLVEEEEDSSSPAVIPYSSSPKGVTTMPTPARSEAPFDEKTPLPVKTEPVAATSPARSHEKDESFSSTAEVIVNLDMQDDMEEPPACDLQEPPSLRTFRRPSSVNPRVTSPASKEPSQYPSVNSPGEHSLPFEDELDQDPTMLEDVEEKKTNDPSPLRARPLISPLKLTTRPVNRAGSAAMSPAAVSPPQSALSPHAFSFSDSQGTTPREHRSPVGASSTSSIYSERNSPTKQNLSTFSPAWSPSSTKYVASQELEFQQTERDTFSSNPEARAWMEEHKGIRPLNPSRSDTLRNRRRIVSQDGIHSVTNDNDDRISSVSAPVMLYHTAQRQETQDRVMHRIRESQSFDWHEKNRESPRRESSRRSPQKQSRSLTKAEMKGSRDSDDGRTRRNSRMEMNQAKYMAMRDNEETSKKCPNRDDSLQSLTKSHCCLTSRRLLGLLYPWILR